MAETEFQFNVSSRWHRIVRKDPYALRPVSRQSPQGCPRNSANICLVEPRRVECRPLPVSTPLSSRRSMLRCSGLSMGRNCIPYLMLKKSAKQLAKRECRVSQNLRVCAVPLFPCCLCAFYNHLHTCFVFVCLFVCLFFVFVFLLFYTNNYNCCKIDSIRT